MTRVKLLTTKICQKLKILGTSVSFGSVIMSHLCWQWRTAPGSRPVAGKKPKDWSSARNINTRYSYAPKNAARKKKEHLRWEFKGWGPQCPGTGKKLLTTYDDIIIYLLDMFYSVGLVGMPFLETDKTNKKNKANQSVWTSLFLWQASG